MACYFVSILAHESGIKFTYKKACSYRLEAMQTFGQASKQPDNEEKILNRTFQTIFFHYAQDNHGKFFCVCRITTEAYRINAGFKATILSPQRAF